MSLDVVVVDDDDAGSESLDGGIVIVTGSESLDGAVVTVTGSEFLDDAVVVHTVTVSEKYSWLRDVFLTPRHGVTTPN